MKNNKRRIFISISIILITIAMAYVAVSAQTIQVGNVEEVYAAVNDPANAGAAQFSGIAYWPEPGQCADPNGADFALNLTGDLTGCLYSFVEMSRCTAAGTYYESGNELYVGLYNGAPGTFRTTYVFTGKYTDCANLSGEIHGGCRHPVVRGSGTAVFEGVTGRLKFRDDVETGSFPYQGHFLWNDATGSDSAIQNNTSDAYTADSVLLPQSGSSDQGCG